MSTKVFKHNNIAQACGMIFEKSEGAYVDRLEFLTADEIEIRINGKPEWTIIKPYYESETAVEDDLRQVAAFCYNHRIESTGNIGKLMEQAFSQRRKISRLHHHQLKEQIKQSKDEYDHFLDNLTHEEKVIISNIIVGKKQIPKDVRRMADEIDAIRPDIRMEHASMLSKLQRLNALLLMREEQEEDQLRLANNPFDNPRADDAGKIGFLVSEILHRHEIRTLRDTGEMVYYRDGIYHHRAEFLIKEEMSKLAGFNLKNVMRNEVLQTIRDRTGVDRGEFDHDPYILNLKNGLLDIHTMKFRPHTPGYLSFSQIPVDYDSKATCPTFIKFLRSTLEPEHAVTILKMMGYILLRNTMFEKGFILVGEGANGKSTLIKLIIRLLGKNNTSGRSVQELAGGDRFAKADLFGKMANLYADLPKGKILDTGDIKMLISGDPVTAHYKHGQPFTLENYAKFVFSCNEIPQSYDNSYAYMRRWVIVPFNRTFEGREADENLLDRLTTPEELSGILNLAICGLKKLQADRGFRDIDINEIKQQYEIGASRIRNFIEEKCILEPGSENRLIEPDRLREAYREYCKQQGTTFFNESDLGKELKALGVEHRRKGPRGKQVYYYIGIQLKEETL